MLVIALVDYILSLFTCEISDYCLAKKKESGTLDFT